MKKLLLTAAVFAIAHSSAQATTVALDAELLKDAFGVPMSTSGLVVLTAGTSGNFFGPTPTSFIGGDEIVLMKWDLSAFDTVGVLSVSTGDLTLSGAWTTGDPLRMYWYPTLTLASTAPGSGTKYGTYRDDVGIDGSAAWITGGPGDTIALKFFTSDATFLNPDGGSNSANAGVANLTVPPVPEPTTLVLTLLTILVMTWSTRRRQRTVAA